MSALTRKSDLSEGTGSCKVEPVPPEHPETESDTVTPDALAIQVVEENQELAAAYAGGDVTALSALQERALKLGAGRVSEHALKDSLMRKLGASY